MHTLVQSFGRSVAILLLIAPVAADAQQPLIVPSSIGMTWRVLGDTIWRERDSTVNRAIYRGDTVTLTSLMNGEIRHEAVYVVRGDSGYVVRGTGRIGTPFPLALIVSNRDGVSRDIQMNESRARMAASRFARPDANEPPLSPPTPLTYPVSPDLMIIQHRDTARYVRKAGGRSDTTTFVFVGDTTVRRISPNPRSFGLAMHSSIVGEMRMSRVTASVAAGNPTVAREIPGPDTRTAPAGLPTSGPPIFAASATGVMHRAHGDTIWTLRDTTGWRTIFVRDTIKRADLLDGRVLREERYLARDDSAFWISSSEPPTGPAPRAMPLSVLTSARDLMITTMRSASTPAPTSATTPPRSPATPASYCISAGLSIIQHGDTARYLRSRGSAIDTSVFVFTGDTTVKRISPTPREFGYTMTNSIRGEMHMALVRRSSAARQAPVLATIPGAHIKGACQGK
jgi:hypothetical protein